MPYKDKAKQRAAQLAYYYRNKQACQQRARKWKLANPERVRDAHRDWWRSYYYEGIAPKRKNAVPTSLSIVQRFYPEVTKVVSAKKGIQVQITDKDVKRVAAKNHKACAIAEACKRNFNVDGAVVSTRTAYLIRGDTATRYQVPEYAAREIVSFDRGAGFAAGRYTLQKPEARAKPGTGKRKQLSNRGPGKLKHRKIHRTQGIRSVLASSIAR